MHASVMALITKARDSYAAFRAADLGDGPYTDAQRDELRRTCEAYVRDEARAIAAVRRWIAGQQEDG